MMVQTVKECLYCFVSSSIIIDNTHVFVVISFLFDWICASFFGYQLPHAVHWLSPIAGRYPNAAMDWPW